MPEFACICFPSSYLYTSSLMGHFNTIVLVSGMPEFVRMNLSPLFLILTESLFHGCPLFIISGRSLQYKCSRERNARVRWYKCVLLMSLQCICSNKNTKNIITFARIQSANFTVHLSIQSSSTLLVRKACANLTL